MHLASPRGGKAASRQRALQSVGFGRNAVQGQQSDHLDRGFIKSKSPLPEGRTWYLRSDNARCFSSGFVRELHHRAVSLYNFGDLLVADLVLRTNVSTSEMKNTFYLTAAVLSIVVMVAVISVSGQPVRIRSQFTP